MGREDVNYIRIKKENDAFKEVLRKCNTGISPRDIEIDSLKKYEVIK